MRNRRQKEYTPLRRFYAWVGFIAILAGTPAVIVAIYYLANK